MKAELKGATLEFASSKVTTLLRLLRECRSREEHEQLKKATPVTHSDDIFCFAGTVFEMFAGSKEWRADKKRAADLWAAQGRELLTTTELRVALPSGMEEVLVACFDSEKTPELTMAQVTARIGRVYEELTGKKVAVAAMAASTASNPTG